MTEKTILVTGGAGYIGSHTCKALAKAGYNPVVYDNLSNGNKEAVKWGAFEKGDILDPKRLKEVLKKYKPEAIIHFAAYIAAGESVHKPGKYYHNNTFGGLNLIEVAIECGIKKIVFSSTAAVYGIPDKCPIDEKSSTNPINPYGYSKLVVENMLKDFALSDNLQFVALRYFNAAGADIDTEIGCDHKDPNNLVPILMNVQAGKKDHIDVYGNDYDTKDGTCIRDYIHVSDLADAHVKALEFLFNKGKSAILNLGTGNGYSVMEVIDSVARVTGKKVPFKNAPRRAGDPDKLIANPKKALEVLGWKAKYTNIDDITGSAWKWQIKKG